MKGLHPHHIRCHQIHSTHMDGCLYEALGEKGYRWVKYGEDELRMKFEIRRMYEINKLDKMWEAIDEKQVHKES